ncbi:MAG TPA: mevalonate kinase [Anaerolineaceae bacterium]|nr:mevalonate kinase [Anaerolineaceae bacterium]
MPAIVVHTVGKSILFGEHAVVYGYPAIAVPIPALKTTVTIFPLIGKEQQVSIYDAPDLAISAKLSDLPENNVLVHAVKLFKDAYAISTIPSFRLKIKSHIPVASGLGSSASVSVGVVKALSQFLGLKLPVQKINDFAFELEKLHHGNPSGIDNTVISYEKALCFTKGLEPEFLQSPTPFHILLIDSGIASHTVEVVSAVKQARENDPQTINSIFQEIGEITQSAKKAFLRGNAQELGGLMQRNHALLQALHVSLPELDTLVSLALNNGAWGAKLCGAGRGGNVIALVGEENAPFIQQALVSHGVKGIVHTVIQ